MKRNLAKMGSYLAITITGYIFGAIAKCKARSFSKRDLEECICITCSNEQGSDRFSVFYFPLGIVNHTHSNSVRDFNIDRQ